MSEQRVEARGTVPASLLDRAREVLVGGDEMKESEVLQYHLQNSIQQIERADGQAEITSERNKREN